MKKKKHNYIGMSWEEHRKELLKDPEFRKALKKHEPEFELAKQMIELRIAKKLTQKALAKKAHTSQVVISRIETGQESPSYELLYRIAKAAGKEIKFV